MGVILKKDVLGNILFTYPTNTTASMISSDNIYESGTEEFTEHTNSIEVSEHSYYNDTSLSSETIYENKDAPSSGSYYASFRSRPVLTNTITPTDANLMLLEKNCNAAVLYGSGSLTGRKYSQNTIIVTRRIADYDDGRTVTVTDATLVTAQNSASIVDKLEAYYGNARKIKNSFIVDRETCGLKYAFESPFNENITGFLTKMSQKPSSILKADSEFICNYTVPSGTNVDYTNYVILTGNGTWQVPQSVFEKNTPRIRVVLIGGGTGGNSGLAGENGQRITSPLGTSAVAKGGDVGDCGVGGNIYDIVIDNPESSYTYICGVGGVGGNISSSTTVSNHGSDGSDTYFSDGEIIYSSANGAKSPTGYRNFFNGDIYAKAFPSESSSVLMGVGGDGGYIYSSDGVYYSRYGLPALVILKSGAFSAYSMGGDNGLKYPRSGNFDTLGGLGGGGAIGGTAGNGTNGTSSKAGNGGKGANAEAIPPKATDLYPTYYGYGGMGGYGGGGGGSSGTYISGKSAGTAGNGGYGGKGGSGSDGCVLIYY